MKKIISVALTVLMTLALATPVLAENTKNKSMTLTYDVGSTYTVIIPPSVDIAHGTGAQTVTVSGGSVIAANKVLNVRITNAKNKTADEPFRLQNNVDNSVYLNYSVTYPTEQTVALNVPFITATPAQVYEGMSVVLTFTTGEAKSAGRYTDSLTFTVSEDIPTP